MAFVVAIDGPSGTGKGTITKLIAKEMGLLNIDTGAMYRSLALKCLKLGINTLEEKERIIETAKNINIEIQHNEENQEIFLDGENVTKEIRTKEVTAFSSLVSSIPEVRETMVNMQRKMAQNKDIIMEGRDITTVVFPNADVKIYLDASLEERAKRRYKENKEKGIQGTFEETLKAMEKRDYDDTHREVAPLRIAEGAVVIDTTKLTIEEVNKKVKEIINEKYKNNSK